MHPMRVVIAGGGVAALEALIALRDLAPDRVLRDLAPDRVDIALVAPEDDFVYRPGATAEPFAAGAVQRLPLARVAADFQAEHVQASLAGVWPSIRVVRLASGVELGYDRLVVALGARRENVFPHALSFGGPEDVAAMRAVVDSVADGRVGRLGLVVPTGTSWSLPLYELALMTARRAREAGADPDLTLVTPEERPLAVFGPEAAGEVEQMLDQAGIRLICSSVPEVPSARAVTVRPGDEWIDCDGVVALPRLSGIQIRSLPHDAQGFLPIDRHGRVRGLDGVYAAGDGTDFPVKQGGIACQQADAAAEAIAKAAGAAIEPRSFRPVLRGRLMTGGESHFMRADLAGREGGTAATGAHPLWWPPEKIAGRYLAPYLHDAMQAPV
jgi:sulfide:quinone oxidoreductase